MSAKITIVTDDPELEAALGLLIAKALHSTGFERTGVKTVSLVNKDSKQSWDKTNVLFTYIVPIGGDCPFKGERSLPELRPVSYLVNPYHDPVPSIIENNPNLLHRAIVLEFHQDKCKKYEEGVTQFLETGRHPNLDPH